MKILYFAPIDWGYIRQRPQHLAQILSDTFEFCYVQPFGLRNLRISDFKRALRRFLGLFPAKKQQGPLKITNLIFIPAISRWLKWLNVRILKEQIRTLTDRETIVWVTTPSRLIPDILSGLQFKALVYEMLDDYGGIHSSLKQDITKTEALLVNRADLIITTSFALLQKAKNINNNKETVYLSNGVDYDFFSRSALKVPVELQGMNKVIGYIGSVDNRIDMETVALAADNMKEADFVFVGPVKIRNLPARKNIHYLGKRDYDMLPHYCNSFDACLIPFSPGEFADTINPVKLYQYFALGKPVVTFRMRELIPMGELLYMAEGKEDFLEKLKLAVSEDDVVVRSKRKELARLNDWKVKAESIREEFSRL